MRDLLTALAGAVILVLVAALAVPPFIDWTAHRALVDRAIGQSLGLAARSEGRIGVRLLPSPRLRLDRLRIGGETGEAGLDIRFAKAEVALAPLLKGEIRFTETRIGRAELRLPITDAQALVLPPGLSENLAGRDLAIDGLHVQQFLLTTTVPATGRTDQLAAENLAVQAPALAGPWRIEGASGGVPFRAVTGEAAPDGSVPLKISGGGETRPRFEADMRLRLAARDPESPAPGTRAYLPEAEGTARLVVGPPTQEPGAYLPFSLSGSFSASGPMVRFTAVNAEVNPGGPALRLAGTGRIDLREGRAALALQARRLDLDAFLVSQAGRDLVARGLPRTRAGLPMMVDLDVAVESAALGLDEWQDIAVAGTVDRTGGVLVRRARATAPGAATLAARGEVDLAPHPRFTGTVSLAAPVSDGFGRYLRRLGLDGPAVAALDGRPVEASADLSAAAPDYSLRNLRLALGGAQITGNARYAEAEAGGRGRIDAQIRANGLDVAELPAFGGALAGLHGRDLGLTIEARDVRYGPAGSAAGRIAARIESDGAGLRVDSLDVTDLAGANARLAGAIAPDGSGRISGRVTAPVAAPLAALLDRAFIPEARLVPGFLRAGALDLAVTVEREAGQRDALRITAKGSAAGGPLDLSLLTRAGQAEQVDVSLATARAGIWFERADIPGLQQPASLRIQGSRPAPGNAPAAATGLALQVGGTIAGLTVATPEPIRLGAEPGPPAGGTLRLATGDLTPFLRLAAGASPGAGPWPADLSLALSRAGEDARADVSGRLGADTVTAALVRAPDGALSGSATLPRLSLPLLAASLVAPSAPGPEAPGGWPSARFAAAPTLSAPASLDLRVARLDLGRGLVATGAAFRLAAESGTLALRDLSARLAEGRLTASVSLARRGGAAAVSGEAAIEDAALAALTGGPLSGRLGAGFRFSATGDSAAALVANLAGTGEIRLADLSVPGVDPGALGRALARALDDEDPLREGRLQGFVADELGKGAAQARGAVATPATIIGGQLRAGPLDLDLGTARWVGSVGLDLRSGRLDARGTLTGGAVPKAWTGAAPAIQLGLTGSLAAPERSLDVGALTNGLSAVVLQRELEKIELIEADQAERQRRRARVEMDRARAAALKAAADRAAAEKAAEEAARQARQRAEDAARARAPDAADPPLDIRPPSAQP
ncbi:AsmA family protein [Methylobacterium sp. A54F]